MSTSRLDFPLSLTLPCIRVSQPIGDFFIASIDSAALCEITIADVRRISDEREVDVYLGIQREVSKARVKELNDFVNTVDACFPTSVILAVEGKCAEFDEQHSRLTLKSYEATEDEGPSASVNRISIARVLDGQHRIEGLKKLQPGVTFQINVSIFVEMDVESQAYLFSIVNLAQTKVNRSLAYDLFEYSKSRSPQKTCHNVAVALDRTPASPFYRRIKRLGVATRGRFTETLTQATFVEALMSYLSEKPNEDRDIYKRRKKPPEISSEKAGRLIFRNMFVREDDLKIADVMFNYFTAVKERWPVAWDKGGTGLMLNKTNGFKALMRLLRPVYLHLATPGDVPSTAEFANVFSKSRLKDDEFSVDSFLPGTTGETKLYNHLLDELNLRDVRGR